MAKLGSKMAELEFKMAELDTCGQVGVKNGLAWTQIDRVEVKNAQIEVTNGLT